MDAEHTPLTVAGLRSEVPDAVPDWIMWMPAGRHSIKGTNPATGAPIDCQVQVDGETAAVMMQSLRSHQAANPQRPYFDFAHSRQEASAWPLEFAWREDGAAGVWARVNWSEPGRSAVAGRAYRAFSPTFLLDRGKVVGAPINMGGLVNDPAFQHITPIWASRPAASAVAPNPTPPMEPNPNTSAGAAGTPSTSTPAAAAATPVAAAAAPATPVTAAAPASSAVQAGAASDLEAVRAQVTTLQSELTTIRQQIVTAGRVTPSGVQTVRADQSDMLRGYVNASTPMQRGRIYTGDIRPRLEAGEHIEFRGFTRGLNAVDAANSLGTLVGALVMQRSLELLRYELPLLSRISTDLSDAPIKWNQNVYVRLITPPAVTSYNADTGYSSSDITATDVAVAINAHKSVQVDVNVQDMAGTNRALLDEQAEAMKYSLSKDLTDALYALILAANFANKETVAQVDFSRDSVINLGVAMTKSKAPLYKRSMVLCPDFYGELAKDTTIVGINTNPDAARSITTGRLPDIHGFAPIEAGNLPSNAQNLVGAGFCPSALCLAARVPDDYTKVFPGAGAGSKVEIITDPDSGLSLMMVQFISHTLARAYSRVAWMYGVAKGDASQLRRIVSA